MPLQASTSRSPHVSRWGQINLTKLVIIFIVKVIGNLIIIARFPSVTVTTTLSKSVPPFTPCTALIIQAVLVEENTVTASATLGHIFGSCRTVVLWQFPLLRALTLKRRILSQSDSNTLVDSAVLRRVTAHNLAVILHRRPLAHSTARVIVLNKIWHQSCFNTPTTADSSASADKVCPAIIGKLTLSPPRNRNEAPSAPPNHTSF